jgi:hypothetical protein
MTVTTKTDHNKAKAMAVKGFNWTTLAGLGLVLLVAAHGLVVWVSIKGSSTIGGRLPWIAGGALITFGLYHVTRRVHGQGHGHSHVFSGRAPDDGERGQHDDVLVNLGHGFVEITIFEADVPPRFRLFFHDKHKQPRTVPAHATVVVETVRPDETRQTFAFQAKGDYLESTTDIPAPRVFRAIVYVSHGSHTHPPHEVHFS